MPERIPVFEPEVEELLLEVAANPDSLLLRGPQRGGVTGPLDLEEGVCARAAGLTVSEKQLLRVWRAEAAEVLRQAFNRSLGENPDENLRVVSLDLNSEEVPSGAGLDLKQRVAQLSRTGRPKHKDSPLAECLRCLAQGDRPTVRMRRLLITLSHRLHPTDRSRVCLGLLEAQENRYGRALAMYQSIAKRSVATEPRAYALSNAVRLYSEMGDQAERLATAQEAVWVAPKWAFSRMKLLRAAMDLGIEGLAESQLAHLLDLGPPARRMMDDHFSWLDSRIERGLLSPKEPLKRVARILSRSCVPDPVPSLAHLAE